METKKRTRFKNSNNNFMIIMKGDEYSYEMQVNGNETIKELTTKLLGKLLKPPEYLNDRVFQTKDKTLDPSSNDKLSQCGLGNDSIISVVNKSDLINITKQLKEQDNSINSKQTKKRFKPQPTIDAIKDILEDMAIMGSIKNIEINNNPNKYYSADEAFKSEDYQIRALGLLAFNLKDLGIKAVIEKEEALGDVEKQNAANNLLQFLVNGLMNKKKYHFNFNLPLKRIQQLNSNPNEQAIFLDKLKVKIMRDFNLAKEDLIVTYYPQSGSFNVLVVFKKGGVGEISKDMLMNNYKYKYDNDFKTLQTCDSTRIIEAVILNKAMLDSRGDNKDGGYGENETRGKEKYIPPKGWDRYGLRVYDQYDNGSNDWLSYENIPGEWAIAYHEIYRKDNFDPNSHFANDNDLKNQGKIVGKGTFCTQDPSFMEEYNSSVIVNDKQYKLGFMLRVKPDKIRQPSSQSKYWVVNGTPDEIRPYGLLYKEM